MVNRRDFFRGFVKKKPGVGRTRADRNTRYHALETLVRIELLPDDFALTKKEDAYLRSRTRSFLEEANDDELFSTEIVRRLKQLVEDILEPWRMASAEVTPQRSPEQLREAAVAKVAVFLDHMSEGQIERLRTCLSLPDGADLGSYLSEEISTWVGQMEDSEILRHDTFTIQEPVFAHLRSICP